MPPNNSFKPNTLRGVKCLLTLRLHAFAATARVGLTQALGARHMTCKFQPGDIFGIPLPDASMGIGQILSLEPDALNSVGCVFFAATARPSGFTGVMEPISVLLVTPDLLKSGVWPVKSQGPVFLETEERPYEIYRASHWVGVRVTGSGIVQEFLAAYHGLTPWDAWHDPTSPRF